MDRATFPSVDDEPVPWALVILTATVAVLAVVLAGLAARSAVAYGSARRR